MTQLADYYVLIALVRGDERKVLTYRLPAAGEDLAVAAGYEIADSIAEATQHEWIRAEACELGEPVTAVRIEPGFYPGRSNGEGAGVLDVDPVEREQLVERYAATAVAATRAAAPPGVGAAVHLPPRFAAMSRMVGEVLAVDPDGTAEVDVRGSWGSYGCFYVPAVELRPCTHIRQAEIDGFLDALADALWGADNGIELPHPLHDGVAAAVTGARRGLTPGTAHPPRTSSGAAPSCQGPRRRTSRRSSMYIDLGWTEVSRLARKYGRILTEIWKDGDFRSLPESAQRAYWMLLSQPDLMHCGVLPYRPSKWASLAADSTVERVRRGVDRLAADRFVVIDHSTQEMFIRTYLRHDDVLKQPNVAICAMRQFDDQIESPLIRAAWLVELARAVTHPDTRILEDYRHKYAYRNASEQLFSLLLEPLPEGFPEGFPEGLYDGFPERFWTGFGKPILERFADSSDSTD
jgi:hypothetical protein